MNKRFLKTCVPLLMISTTLLTGLTALMPDDPQVSFTHEQLQDKIKGGWAGQVIGVTFGGPTEFRYNGTYIQDYQTIDWHEGYVKETMEDHPYLFDDIYMDLTFVDVIERLGVDAPVDSFANAFAYAEYPLWHANQAARYNIINGIDAPKSGHWQHNPHADDIDYQIEADFAGLMNPGMPNSASDISDKVGHIMNYGDGWYGGVYVGAMYSLAFVSQDIHQVVKDALITIPKQSEFYKCIQDVITWHKQYPDDWKMTWFELQKKWTEEVGCPEGVFAPMNIDAKINAAYIVLGLLYGDGDFTKTMEISTRAGFDSDCNPSSAGGILGTMLGYKNIPDYWKNGLKGSENINFKYTNMSLNNVYEVGYKHALEMIKRNGGQVADQEVKVALQAPKTVRFEKSFEGVFPVEKKLVGRDIDSEYTFEFEGTGLVLRGGAFRKNQKQAENHLFKLKVLIDDQQVEAFDMSTDDHQRRHDIFWKYDLPKGKHQVKVIVTNPAEDYRIHANDIIVYSDVPNDGFNHHNHIH